MSNLKNLNSNPLTLAQARAKKLEAELKLYKQALNSWGVRAEAWKKEQAKYKKQIADLQALIKEVKDHVDPTKKDIVLAAKKAKSWVSRAVKILKAIF